MSDLTKAHANATAVGSPLGNAIEGLEELGAGDFSIPRWSMIQPTSQKKGADDHQGSFMRNLDGEFAKTLEVVILKVSPNRLLWSGDRSDTRPECFSRDGAHGSVYGDCATCIFNPMFNRALLDEKKSNPQTKVCGYGYNLVVATADGDERGALSLIGATGTSVRPIKALNTTFSQRGRSPFSAIVRFEAERTTNDQGKYYVLKPTVIRWLDAAESAEWRNQYLAIKSATIKDIDEDEAPGAESDAAEIPAGNAAF